MPTCSLSLRRPREVLRRATPLSRASHVPSRLLLQSGMVSRWVSTASASDGGPEDDRCHTLAVALSGFGAGKQAKFRGVLTEQRGGRLPEELSCSRASVAPPV